MAQTYTNWICEVHNDDPNDNFPGKHIDSLNDNRFTIINHEHNLGPVAAFNLAFNNCMETYISILEDDNWWEPEFLETMFHIMETHKDIQTSWSNMYLWQEELYGKWTNIYSTIWPRTDKQIKLFNFPQHKQAITALHSNGAMLVRNVDLYKLKVPDNTRFDFIEPIRERAFHYPLLLVNKPLANFSFTLNTSRQDTINGMYEHYILLIDSFFKNVENNEAYAKLLWADARQQKLRSYIKLLYTGFTCKSSRSLLKYATLKEWLVFILYNIKYPLLFKKCINAKKTYFSLWEYLMTNTRERVLEANA